MNCGNCTTGTKLCSRCRNKRYCSIECQRRDWENHKNNCKDITEVIRTGIKNNNKALDLVEQILTYIENPIDKNYINVLNVIVICPDLNDSSKNIVLFAVFLADKKLDQTYQGFKTNFKNIPKVDKLPIFIYRFIHKANKYKCLSINPQCIAMKSEHKLRADKVKNEIRNLFPVKYGFDIRKFENSEFMLILENGKLFIVEDETFYKKLINLKEEEMLDL